MEIRALCKVQAAAREKSLIFPFAGAPPEVVSFSPFILSTSNLPITFVFIGRNRVTLISRLANAFVSQGDISPAPVGNTPRPLIIQIAVICDRRSWSQLVCSLSRRITVCVSGRSVCYVRATRTSLGPATNASCVSLSSPRYLLFKYRRCILSFGQINLLPVREVMPSFSVII